MELVSASNIKGPKMKRRKFIKTSIGTAVILSTPSLFLNCKEKGSIQEIPQKINARVAAVKGNNLDSMTRDAVDALGGMKAVVKEGETVFIKPNFVSFPWAQLTLAMKNFIGITPLSRYAQLVNNTWRNRGTFDHRSPQAIAQVYLDIVKNIKPDLSIIDFSIGIEGDGPTRDYGATTLNMKDRLGSWAVIASKDILAAEATAARIMKHNVRKIKQLTMGFDMELGEIREESIAVIGEKLDNLRVNWKPASLKG